MKLCTAKIIGKGDTDMMIGNLTIEQIEERLGIKLTSEERRFLFRTRQLKATEIGEYKWHCFDIPFAMVCGSMRMATDIYNILKKYSDDMKEQLHISIID